jgi:hypothetical protein
VSPLQFVAVCQDVVAAPPSKVFVAPPLQRTAGEPVGTSAIGSGEAGPSANTATSTAAGSSTLENSATGSRRRRAVRPI